MFLLTSSFYEQANEKAGRSYIPIHSFYMSTTSVGTELSVALRSSSCGLVYHWIFPEGKQQKWRIPKKKIKGKISSLTVTKHPNFDTYPILSASPFCRGASFRLSPLLLRIALPSFGAISKRHANYNDPIYTYVHKR